MLCIDEREGAQAKDVMGEEQCEQLKWVCRSREVVASLERNCSPPSNVFS